MPERRSQPDYTEMGIAMAQAIVAGLRPTLDKLGEDKDDRHNTANVAQSAIELATANKIRVERIEKTVEALLGDGTGENGKLAIMGTNIRKTQDDVSEVKGDIKQLLANQSELKATAEQSKSWMSGARGVWIFLAVMTTLVTIIGGIIGVLVKLYKG